ncbi:MAG TPA: hybrid sensor histidine kinase/response regulator, partial [Cyanothece sp. UBA12306]|nr:hybrid sensor histidine kinase/response regulator [Cyanothece sp. UBA12306]
IPADLEILQNILGGVKPSTIIPNRSLTLLRLYPNCIEQKEPSKSLSHSLSEWSLVEQLSLFNHRILEADDLEQAQMLVRVWQVDVIVLDGSYLDDSTDYLQSLSQCSELASLPLITLDIKTTEAANQVDNLLVFPCLIPDNKQNVGQLWEVIQIAASSKS